MSTTTGGGASAQDELQRSRERIAALEVAVRRRGASLQFLQLITKTYVSLTLTEKAPICDTLLSLAASFLETRHGAVLLFARPDAPVASAVRGIATPEVLLGSKALALWSTAMETKVARALSGAELAELWPDPPEFLASGLACAAIDVEERPVGVVVVSKKLSEEPFHEHDLEFLEGAAGIAAMALRNADAFAAQHRLVEERERQAVEANRQSEEKERALAELDQKLEIIQRQRLAIEELSTPILQLWDDVLALPIIGQIDSNRAVTMTEGLLERIVKSGSKCVIIDVTGVHAIDTSTVAHFIKMMEAARLLGSHCVITGIGSQVARTLVALDVHFGSAPTFRNLREGLKHCLAYLREGARKETLGND